MFYFFLKRLILLLGRFGPQTVSENIRSIEATIKQHQQLQIPGNDVITYSPEELNPSPFTVPLEQRGIRVETLPSIELLPEYSLVTTCKNESKTICQWLESVAKQTTPPNEVVICDGGSRDNTLELVKKWVEEKAPNFIVQLIEQPGSNIATGRNEAVRESKNEILLFSDIGTILDRHWAEFLLRPFSIKPNTQVVMGWYQVKTQGDFSKALSTYLTPQLATLDPAIFLPSGRSLAIKREVFDAVGGYPEELTFAGEDTLFDLRLKEKAEHIAFSPAAFVFWLFPTSLFSQWRMITRYAFGDAEGGMFWANYLTSTEKVLKFVFDAFAFVFFTIIAFWVGSPIMLMLAFLCGALGMFQMYKIGFSYNPFFDGDAKAGRARLFAAYFLVFAQVRGFLGGLISRQGIEKVFRASNS